MPLEINDIPHQTLRQLNARRAVIMTTAQLQDEVLISTSLEPSDLHVIEGLDCLSTRRRLERVYSITMTILRVDRELIEAATSFLENRFRIMAELDTLLQYQRYIYVVYVITHYNPEQKPFGPLTVNIGGDCYRTDSRIKDLESILDRTRDLAEAMLKKSVLVFPEVPALHGGKKGEWIVLDDSGRKIEGISEEAIIALGSEIIPRGIEFLNRYKELEARRLSIFDHFPESNYIRSDSGSPDVLSGIYWRGERKEKYINMCDAWHRRGVDLLQFTCLPANLGGTLDASARPTGYGVATTTVELARRYFEPQGRSPESLRFLLEAAGGVGRNTIEALVTRYGIPPSNITVFDRQEAATSFAASKFQVQTATLNNDDFYGSRLPEETRAGHGFDVWINNGEGDNTSPEVISTLLAAGVRVFTGGANNFLQVRTEAESRDRIFETGGWAWPDPATSGGGWLLAVIGILTRCQGQAANTEEKRHQILDLITTRNRRLVADVLDELPTDAAGGEIWQHIDHLIDQRVRRTLEHEATPEEIRSGADTRSWRLT